ncbi:MAG: ribokinase, partial [Anaerolineaceae bacterium]|nr:ribokinase [Anaerolineaceae bacterium]
MREIDLLILGDYCFDLVFNGLNSMPELGKEIVASGFEFVPGGAYNTVAACQHLKLDFLWASDFGTDMFSQLVLKSVKECGINEDLFCFHDRSLRNLTVACSYPTDRAFIAFYDPAPKIRA